jgi:CRISPR system Cascade subunit CasA
MKQKFDLLEEDWIPCIRLNGKRDKLSLYGVLKSAHKLRELDGASPLVIGSVYRFLLAVLYAIYQPEHQSDWEAIWKKHRFNVYEIDDYFTQAHVRERFDLFHETNPFYQTTEQIGKPLSLSALLQKRASGNNATLFDHSTDKILLQVSADEAVCFVIAFHAFAVGFGKSGIQGKSFTDAPCSRGFLSFAEGKTLFETLVLNLIPYEWQPQEIFAEPGIPAWEMDNPLEDDRTIPNDLLDYLTWQSRRINLSYKNNNLAVFRSQGLKLDKEAVLFDPLKAYRHDDKKGYQVIGLSANRVLWRDSHALFRVPGRDNRPPAVFDWLSRLTKSDILSEMAVIRFLVFGLATEKGKAASITLTRMEHLPLPLKLTTEPKLVERLEFGLYQAEKVKSMLINIAQRMGMFAYLEGADQLKWKSKRDVSDNDRKRINNWITHTGMERNYWASLDLPFQAFIVELARDEEKALDKWHAQLQKSTWSSFQLATQSLGNDARSFKAMVKGESYLRYRLSEILPESKKEKMP